MEKEALFEKLWISYIIIILASIFIIPIVSSIISILLVVTTAWYVYKTPSAQRRFKKRKKEMLFLSSIYWIAILSLLWTDSENLSLGLAALETQLSILIFPVVFSFIQVTQKNILLIIRCLAILIISSFLLFIMYTFVQSESNLSLELLVFSLSEKVHRTYISLYSLTFGFILFLYLVSKNKTSSSYAGYFFLLVLVIITQLYESRIALLSIPILSVTTLLYLKKKKQKIVLGVVLPFFVIIVFFFVVNNSSQRVKDIIIRYKTSISKHNIRKIEDRIIVWQLSLRIIQDNFVLGVGVGDSQNAILEACKENTPNLTYTDVHNQYLDVLMKYGILGFLIFILILVYPFILAIKNSNPYYLIFLIVIFVFFLTESILIRQIGVMFYAIFNSMFYYSSLAKKNYCSEYYTNKLQWIQKLF